MISSAQTTIDKERAQPFNCKSPKPESTSGTASRKFKNVIPTTIGPKILEAPSTAAAKPPGPPLAIRIMREKSPPAMPQMIIIVANVRKCIAIRILF